MSKRRSRVLDFLIYLAVRVVVGFIELLSYETGCALADVLAWLAYHADRRHRAVALENVRHAFPDLSERRADRLVRGIDRHFCTLIIDIVHARRKLHITNWRRHIHFDEARCARYAFQDSGYLVVTGHFGNWEISNYVSGLLGFHTFAI